MSQKQARFSPHLLVFERKFDTALRQSHGINWLRKFELDDLSRDDQLLVTNYEKMIGEPLEPSNIIINTNIFPLILQEIIETHKHSKIKTRLPTMGTIKKIKSLISQNINIQIGWNTDKSDPQFSPLKELNSGTSKWKLGKSMILSSLLQVVPALDHLVNSLSKSEIRVNAENEEKVENKLRQCRYTTKSLPFKCIWNRASALILFRDKIYLVPRSYILMIHNKIHDMISVLVLCCLTPDNVYPDDDILSLTEDFILEYARLAIKYDQEFFNISKVLEALIIGESLQKLEGTRNSQFINTIIEDCEQKTGFSYAGSNLEEILTSCSIPFAHELSCLSKIMGHPFCDVKQGAIELEERVNENKIIDIKAVADCIRHAKRHFLTRYFHKHGKYPLVDFTDVAHPGLARAILKNIPFNSPALLKKYGVITNEAFDNVELQPMLEFNMVENFLPYVKDRTISLGRSQVLRKYFENIKLDKSTYKETRLLLCYLLMPLEKTNHMEYMENYIGGNWEDIMDYFVIRIVPKEKEHKKFPRGFGCKSAFERARGIIQELNSAHFLDVYSDEQAMTLTELQLIQKLYAFRNLEKAYAGYAAIYINIDASAWNNRFRRETVDTVMHETLDKIFGTPIFSKTHLAYQNTLVYVPDVNTCYGWDGQKGGIEGLNQDTWVYVYTHQIKVCFDELPYPYFILCKGDDLRVCVLIPPSVLQTSTIDTIRRDLMTRISKTGAKFGHVLKIEDSYASESYFAFSKNAFVKNIEQPQTYRKIQKAYGANNAFMSTLDDYASSSFSNAHSASKTGPSVIACYGVALWWFFYALLQHNLYKTLNDSQLVSLSLVPNLLGGFPIIYLHNFFVRAESDLLTPFIDLLQYTKKHFTEIHQYLYEFTSPIVKPSIECFTGFLIDPYSLPLDLPRSASTVLKQAVSNVIQKMTLNEHIQELYEAQEDGLTETIISVLYRANVYNAKLFSSLYDSTPDGIIRELICKFESGRSVMDVIILHSSRRKSNSILRSAFRADESRHQYRIQVLKSTLPDSTNILPSNYLNMCSTQVAQIIRDKLWGKPVESITQPCLQHLIKVGPPHYFGVSEHALNNHFEYNIDITRPPANGSWCFSSGSHMPFLGSITGKGMAPPQAVIITKNLFSSKIHKLLELYKWSHMTGYTENRVLMSSNLHELIDKLIRMYTKKTAYELAPFSSQRLSQRTVHQRLKINQYKTSIIPNTLYNIYTRFIGVSRSHVFLEQTTDHYRINFLQAYCHVVSLWSLKPWSGISPSLAVTQMWAVTENCDFCMTPIYETPVIVDHNPVLTHSVFLSTEISKIDLVHIQDEIDNYEMPEYYIPEEPEDSMLVTEAEVGLLQFYIKEHLAQRSKILDTYSHHRLSESAVRVFTKMSVSGKTLHITANDLKYISISRLFEEACLLIVAEIHKIIKEPNLHTLHTMLSVIPSSELPWTPILSDLNKCGRTYEILRHMRVHFSKKVRAMYDNYESLSPLFGVCCYTLYTSATNLTYQICHLSRLQIKEIQQEDRLKGNLIHIRYFCKDFCTLYKRSEGRDPTTRYGLLLTSIYASFTKDWVEELTEETQKIYNDTGKAIIQLHHCMAEDEILDALDFLESDEDEAEDIYYLFKHLMGCLKGLASKEQLIEIYRNRDLHDVNQENWIREAEEKTRSFTFFLYKADPITCLNKLRASYRGREVPEIQPLTKHVKLPPIIRPKSRYVNFAIESAKHASPGVELEAVALGYVEPPDQERTIFNSRWLVRPAGTGNISASRLLFLLDSLKITELPEQITVMCLADGYGGYTTVVNQFTKNSKIIFNTLPNTIDAVPEPSVLDNIARGNLIDNEMITKNISNLTEPITIEWLLKRDPEIHVITCDVEIITNDEELILKISQRVMELFIRGGQPTSILIYKTYLKYPVVILNMISKLTEFCQSLFLTISPSSALNGEVYLIGQKPSNVQLYLLPSRFNEVTYPSIKNINKYNKYCRDYNQRIQSDEGGTNVLTIRTNYSKTIKSILPYLPNYGLSKAEEVMKVIIRNNNLRQLAQSPRQWCNNIIRDVEPQLEVVMNEIRNQNTTTISTRFESLKHLLIMFARYLQIRGFIYAVNRFGEKRPLVKKELQQELISSLRWFTDTTAVNVLHHDINDDTNNVLGYKFSSVQELIIGARWGVCFLTWGKN